jgi:hypothetical protein
MVVEGAGSEMPVLQDARIISDQAANTNRKRWRYEDMGNGGLRNKVVTIGKSEKWGWKSGEGRDESGIISVVADNSHG